MSWNTYVGSSPPGVRQVWLTLGTRSIPLDNPAGGWFCTELDLGWPEVRAVTNNRPDDDGIDDRTQFFGARAITVHLKTLAGAGARIDDVADSFGPYMVPSARPTLHYILDRPGATERTLTVRGNGYAWPISGDSERDIQLSFVAADPAVYDAVQQSANAYAGSTATAGRLYDMVYPRTYPSGGGVATTGYIVSNGDLPVQPLLRIYGPIDGPRVHFAPQAGGTGRADVNFVSSFHIDAGHWVDVDCNNKTAFRDSDPTQPAFASLNFATTVWPYLPVMPAYTAMQLFGAGAQNNVTQVIAYWQDAYLS